MVVGVLWSGFFGVMNFRRPQPNFANAIRWRKKKHFMLFGVYAGDVCVCVFVSVVFVFELSGVRRAIR